MSEQKLSTEAYKGVRDFFPEEMRVQKYIFGVMRSVSERFGYEEYTASVLEPAELYTEKSGEEIVGEQTYTFKDRGERSVTLRPEMTPTVARMVAQKRKELSFPLRWYSIPNLFRYERPQRGRLREHWQLNCDIFGAKSVAADTEIILLAESIMREFGAKREQFEIRINHRALTTLLFEEVLNLDEKDRYTLSKCIDKKEKISKEEFENEVRAATGERADALLKLLEAETLEAFCAQAPLVKDSEAVAELNALFSALKEAGVENIRFSPSLMRGFDYYTGMVFEVFDTHKENNRSLFGGGRYDDLLSLFGVEPVSAVGFGMGDVTIEDFLTTHELMPLLPHSLDLYLCCLSEADRPYAQALALELRESGLMVALNLTERKVGDQIAYADKIGASHTICIGERERESGRFSLKELASGKESEVGRDDIVETIFGAIE